MLTAPQPGPTASSPLLRRDNMLTLRSGLVSLPDRARLAALVDHRPARVTAAPSGTTSGV